MRFCPHCGGRLKAYNHHHYRCLKCRRITFQNPIPAMCALFIRGGRLLYVKRASEPKKGYWDFPGGFLEPGETIEGATVRECREELGVKVEVTGFLGTWPSVYIGRHYRSTVLNVYVFCRLTMAKLKPASDITEARWFPINRPPKMIAFRHMKSALKKLKSY